MEQRAHIYGIYTSMFSDLKEKTKRKIFFIYLSLGLAVLWIFTLYKNPYVICWFLISLGMLLKIFLYPGKLGRRQTKLTIKDILNFTLGTTIYYLIGFIFFNTFYFVKNNTLPDFNNVIIWLIPIIWPFFIIGILMNLHHV